VKHFATAKPNGKKQSNSFLARATVFWQGHPASESYI
jgi:hypothetical protein